ncbi:MAG TPA: hypothetical protein VNO30_49630 [Kofleriaceae bacterium]|nr:hypothetical protein [Kofleriaceae bacterium]
MQRRAITLLFVLASACGSKPAPRTVPAPAAARPAPAPTKPARDPSDPSPWPVPMRVMTWTPDGIVRIGELPWSPPQPAPTTPWFIEPSGAVDQPKLAQIVGVMRQERTPGLSLRGQRIEALLGELRDLPDLKTLLLDGTAADGAALAEMDVSLTRLYLARTAVDDAAVAAIVLRHPALEALDLENTGVGDAAAKAITKLAGLRAINFGGTRLTDLGGAELRALGQLEIVDLGHTKVGPRTVAALRDLAIRELFLDGTRAGKEIATLAGFTPGLRRFDVSSLATYKPVDADVAWLAHAPELVEVGLSGARVTDKLVIELAKLPKLSRLRLASTPITLAAIAQIAARGATAGLEDLGELDLAGTPVDDAHAARLISAPKMRILRLDRTPVTDLALTTATPGSALSELYLSHTKVTDQGLEILDRLPYLSGLGLAEAAIGAPTLARIAKLRELHTLVLSSTGAPREALRGLGQLGKLESLYLDRTRADDETLAQLAPLRGLRVLHLAQTDVSDASLAQLRGFSQLEELTLGDTRVRAPSLELDAWPKLHTLSVLGLGLGDAALPALARHRALAVLDLSSTEIRDPAPLVALPNLRILGLVMTKLTKPGLASVKALAARGVEIVQ